jgi:hypothetical protein
MAIDYVIDYLCVPKQTLTTEGIVERLKGKDRAEAMIAMYRRAGDQRPPNEIGFEFTRRTSDGREETMIVEVQHLLDEAADLPPLAHHCQQCPANRSRHPFGCIGQIQYPLSQAGEEWLLGQFPDIHEPLVWLLLKQGIENFQYDGATVKALRDGETYFEARTPPMRHMGDFLLTANQVFEMLFVVGDIIPNHASVLLLFLKGLNRDLEAHVIMQLTPAPNDAAVKYPFQHDIKPNDDPTIAELKEFLHALYIAWRLNVNLQVDA